MVQRLSVLSSIVLVINYHQRRCAWPWHLVCGVDVGLRWSCWSCALPSRPFLRTENGLPFAPPQQRDSAMKQPATPVQAASLGRTRRGINRVRWGLAGDDLVQDRQMSRVSSMLPPRWVQTRQSETESPLPRPSIQCPSLRLGPYGALTSTTL